MNLVVPDTLKEHVESLAMMKLRLGHVIRVKTVQGEVFFIPAPNISFATARLEEIVRRRLGL